MDEHAEVLVIRLVGFLDKFSWLFNFSNVKIMSVFSSWPKDWKDYIFQTNVRDLKMVLKQESVCNEGFVQEFVRERNELVTLLEKHFIRTENKDGGIKQQIMDQSGGNVSRGMSSKKIHEVQCMSDFIIGKNSTGHDLIIDVGSGAGHLERAILKIGFGMYFWTPGNIR